MRLSRPTALFAALSAALYALACSSETTETGATAGPSKPNLGGCYPTDPKCTIAGSKCMALTDVSNAKKKTLRISQLKVGKPSALASTTINFTIIGPAVTIQDNEACHLRPGTEAGTFNWPKPSAQLGTTKKMRLKAEALEMLLSGIDLKGAKLRPWYQRE